ncbi:MAG: recombinase family protein [Gallionella sp.]|nr:recombinase family protein [Gallionella sp.]
MQEQENTNGEGQTQTSLFRAAEYVRMSTEHQQYSTENQADKIREYAARRGIEIIKTYADAGKSGLRIDGRQALQQLIKDVETGAADFQVILVYDVIRQCNWVIDVRRGFSILSPLVLVFLCSKSCRFQHNCQCHFHPRFVLTIWASRDIPATTTAPQYPARLGAALHPTTHVG